MTITLNHTIVPARDKEASARFFARLFGLKVETPIGHFAAVQVIEVGSGLQCAELQQRLGTLELARVSAELAKEYGGLSLRWSGITMGLGCWLIWIAWSDMRGCMSRWGLQAG